MTLAKAKAFDDLQATGEVVKKQVKAAPKTVKSSKPVKRSSKVQREADDARKKLRASGGKDLDSAVALLKAKRNR